MSNATGCANWLRNLIVVACASVILLGGGLCGCVDVEQARVARADAAALRTHLDQRIESDTSTLAALEAQGTPGNDPAIIQARQDLALSHARRDQINTLIQQVDELLTQADALNTNPLQTSGGINDTIATVGQTFPEPLRSPLLLGAGAMVALLRAAQLKRALASVARGIDAAMKQDPDFKDKFLQHANTFRTMQTATARRAIDELKRPPVIRIPL